MKKIILAVLLGLGIAQVAPVMADDVVVAETAKKESFFKKHKKALLVGSVVAVSLAGLYTAGVVKAEAGQYNENAGKTANAYQLLKKDDVTEALVADGELKHVGVDAFEAPGAADISEKVGGYRVVVEQMVPNMVDYKGISSAYHKAINGFPKALELAKFAITGYGLKGYKRGLAIAGNVVAAAIIIDLGYKFIAEKPELAETIYNKFFAKNK